MEFLLTATGCYIAGLCCMFEHNSAYTSPLNTYPGLFSAGSPPCLSYIFPFPSNLCNNIAKKVKLKAASAQLYDTQTTWIDNDSFLHSNIDRCAPEI